VRCLAENHQVQCRFTNGINYLIKLAVILKEIDPGGNQSLKSTWMNFQRLSFAIQEN
jgi:hypothetical protein